MDLSKMSMTELKYLLQQAANEEKSLEKLNWNPLAMKSTQLLIGWAYH